MLFLRRIANAITRRFLPLWWPIYRTPSHVQSFATQSGEETYLGSILRAREPDQTDVSAFMIFEKGGESLKARLSLIHSTEKTLDLQYYAINNDITSNLLIESAIRASKRGVRVRLLLDDLSVGKIYKSLLFLDSLKNIEVRIFNPIVTTKDQTFVSRLLVFIINRASATKRMHNKAIIADNQFCMSGGRNLGDEYFDSHKELMFKDIDALAAGPVTLQVSKSFDSFWNSSDAYPITDLYGKFNKKRYEARLIKSLQENWNEALETDDGKFLEMLFEDFLEVLGRSFVWASGQYISDSPDKVKKQEENTPSGPLLAIEPLVNNAQKEFIAISPYFVPYGAELDWLMNLERHGIHVRILTNSLASTDVVAVHTGYAPHRLALIQSGVGLYELKPIGRKKIKQRLFGRGAPSHASLHAKVYVADQKISMIGSLNFDPRSSRLNTEGAFIINSGEIAEQLHSLFEKALAPDICYRIDTDENNNIIFRTISDGKEAIYRTEPDCSIWRRMQCSFFSLLPVKDQL